MKKTIYTFALLLLLGNISFAQKAGQIHPNAKTINATNLESGNFSGGICEVGRNGYKGLINANGDFTLNYATGKSFHGNFSNGNIVVSELPNQSQTIPEQQLSGLINQNGQVMLSLKGYILSQVSNDRLILRKNQNNYAGIVVDRKTLKIIGDFSSIYKFKPSPSLSANGQAPPKIEKVRENDFLYSNMAAFSISFISKGLDFTELWGFIDLNGKIIVPPIYYEVGEVSEGVCAVKSKDKFGSESWGFVNEKGEIEIDFIFSSKPRAFHEGKAKFTSTNFNGFIDRKGNLLFKTTFQEDSGDQNKFDRTNALPEINENIGFVDFHENLAFLGRTNRNSQVTKIIDEKGLIKSLKFQEGSIVSHFRNGTAIFKTYNNQSETVYGMINLKGDIVLQPIFTELLPFDEVSGLAKARKSDIRTGEKIDGYINKQGVFIILMQEGKTTKY